MDAEENELIIKKLENIEKQNKEILESLDILLQAVINLYKRDDKNE